jgi:hypothetical protein
MDVEVLFLDKTLKHKNCINYIRNFISFAVNDISHNLIFSSVTLNDNFKIGNDKSVLTPKNSKVL